MPRIIFIKYGFTGISKPYAPIRIVTIKTRSNVFPVTPTREHSQSEGVQHQQIGSSQHRVPSE